MIDTDGYRLNVGIILGNQDGKLLWAKRVGQNAWQFPQGGMKAHESPKQAMFRELHEEIGLSAKHVRVIGSTSRWLRYRLPNHLIRYHQRPLCIGQKQLWYLLRMNCSDDTICLDNAAKPEFETWYWADYWHPLKEVVHFKKQVYEMAMKEFEPMLQKANARGKSNTHHKARRKAPVIPGAVSR